LLAFRDHLQEDADARAAYTKIKVDLAPRADADGYLQAKTAFIEATLAGIDV
ncbi:MAG TPA: GrpB family protein, partial [Gemmatimonadetes bacterium]|nr:GrpB family protein [Gemmatimonadota bacterium]